MSNTNRSNIGGTSSTTTHCEQKLPSREELDKLLEAIRKSKESLEDELKNGPIKDAATIEQLTGLPQELQRSIDLLKNNLKNIPLFCEDMATECKGMTNKIDSCLNFIESQNNDHRDAGHAKTLLEVIKKNYLDFKNELLPKTSQPSASQAHYLDSERLRLEQQILCSHQETKAVFTAVLYKIANANSHYAVPQSCYISYALPYKQTSEEKLLYSFVEQLKADIRSAGIVANDIQNNLSGNRNEYQEKEIKKASYIIVVGTPALLSEYWTGSYQLVAIENRRKTDSKCILPILLIGESEAAFPADFGCGFTTIADWRKSSYQANLKLLLQILYSIGTDNAEYQTFWQTFEAKYAFLTKGLSPGTTTKLLAEAAKNKQLEEEMDAQAAEKCFQEIKNIISASYGNTVFNSSYQQQSLPASQVTANANNVYITQSRTNKSWSEELQKISSPPSANGYCVDRKDAMLKLDSAFYKQQKDNKPVGLLKRYITGQQGVGKTLLMQKFMLDNKDKYGFVYYISAKDNLKTAFRNLAEKIGIKPDFYDNNVQLANAVYRKLIREFKASCLLGFDNVDSAVIRDFLPDLPQQDYATVALHILVTSINSNKFAWKSDEELPLDVFTSEEAKVYASGELKAENVQAISSLITTLGSLPLALSHAIAYLGKTKQSIQQYLIDFAKLKDSVLNNRIFAEGNLVVYDTTVYKTFLMSIKKIEQEDPNALQTLAICAYLNPDNISYEILSKLLGGQSDLFTQVIAALTCYSLVEEKKGAPDPAIKIHRVLQAVILKAIEEKDLKITLPLENIFACIKQLTPHGPDQLRPYVAGDSGDFNLLKPHLRFLLERLGTDSTDCTSELLDDVGVALERILFLPDEAITYLKIAEQKLLSSRNYYSQGAYTARFFSIQLHLATAYLKANQPQAALKSLSIVSKDQSALKIMRDNELQKSRFLTTFGRAIVSSKVCQGNGNAELRKEVEDKLVEAEKINASSPLTMRELLTTQSTLGSFYEQIDGLNKAREKFTIVLEQNKNKLYGQNHYYTASAYKSLGEIYEKLHNSTEALKNFLACYRIYRTNNTSVDDEFIAKISNHLAQLKKSKLDLSALTTSYAKEMEAIEEYSKKSSLSATRSKESRVPTNTGMIQTSSTTLTSSTVACSSSALESKAAKAKEMQCTSNNFNDIEKLANDILKNLAAYFASKSTVVTAAVTTSYSVAQSTDTKGPSQEEALRLSQLNISKQKSLNSCNQGSDAAYYTARFFSIHLHSATTDINANQPQPALESLSVVAKNKSALEIMRDNELQKSRFLTTFGRAIVSSKICQEEGNEALCKLVEDKLVEAEKINSSSPLTMRELLTTQSTLGSFYEQINELNKAREKFTTVLKQNIKTYGPNYGYNASIYNSLGEIYKNQGNLEEALKNFLECYRIYRTNKTSVDNEFIAKISNNLAQLKNSKLGLSALTSYAEEIEAIEEYLKKSSLLERKTAETKTMQCSNNSVNKIEELVNDILKNLDAYFARKSTVVTAVVTTSCSATKSTYAKIDLQAVYKYLDANQPQPALEELKVVSENKLALQIMQSNKLEKSKFLTTFGRAIVSSKVCQEKGNKALCQAVEDKLVEAEHINSLSPSTMKVLLTTQSMLGSFYEQINERDKARAKFKIVLAQNIKSYGPNHDYTASTYKSLGEIDEKQGNSEEALKNFLACYRIYRTNKPNIDNEFIAKISNHLAQLKNSKLDLSEFSFYIKEIEEYSNKSSLSGSKTAETKTMQCSNNSFNKIKELASDILKNLAAYFPTESKVITTNENYTQTVSSVASSSSLNFFSSSSAVVSSSHSLTAVDTSPSSTTTTVSTAHFNHRDIMSATASNSAGLFSSVSHAVTTQASASENANQQSSSLTVGRSEYTTNVSALADASKATSKPISQSEEKSQYFHAHCKAGNGHSNFFGPGRKTKEEAEKDLKIHNEAYCHTNGCVTPTSELDGGVECGLDIT